MRGAREAGAVGRALLPALSLMLGLAPAACTPGRRAPSGPVVSPTGIVYEPGVPPRETRFSQTADLYFSQSNDQRALEFALQGIAADSTNPLHYFLAGSAYARVERYVEADAMLDRAQGLYPAYELNVEPERESAWSLAFNAGVEAYQAGDLEAAIRAWKDATVMFDLRPEAHLNLARLLADEGRYAEAISVYQAALAGLQKAPATRPLDADALRRRAEARLGAEEPLAQLLVVEGRYAEAEPLTRRQLERDSTDVQVRSQLARILDLQGRADEASEIYSAMLTEETLESYHLLNLGVGLFHASKFREAALAFRRLTDVQQESRDAWFNYANALFAAEAWDELTKVGERLLGLDPLGENAALITAKAHFETGERDLALRGLERSDAAPVHLEQIYIRRSSEGATVHAQVHGNAAEPGTPVRLRFEFYDPSGSLGVDTVTITAPGRDETTELTVTFAGPAAWYRYEVLPGQPG